jgi:hypothetical protein
VLFGESWHAAWHDQNDRLETTQSQRSATKVKARELEATGYLAETTGYLAIDEELSDAALEGLVGKAIGMIRLDGWKENVVLERRISPAPVFEYRALSGRCRRRRPVGMPPRPTS